jgi:Protein containing tetrapyrrole methyltransferase domain and MazG-like (predicted pyrophosphatase) domain
MRVTDGADRREGHAGDAHIAANQKAIEHEIGDVLFAAVNIARRAGVDPEQALRGGNRRFETRFRFVEVGLVERGMTFAEASPDTLDDLWEAAKRAERGHTP